MKYIEVGIGNTWIIRTETELSDGSEIEQKGIIKPIIFHSVYLRVWLGNRVLIWDSKDGVKIGEKDRLWFEMNDGKVISFGMNPAIG